MTSAALVWLEGVVVLLAMVFHYTPRWARPDIFFGVTVPPRFPETGEGSRILGCYRRRIWMHATLCAVAAPLAWNTVFAALLIPLAQVAGAMFAWGKAHGEARHHAVAAAPAAPAAVGGAGEGLPGGWPLFLGPFAILAGAGVYLRLNWDQIPERFPIHWGLDGQPDRWTTRSFGGVYGILIVGLFTCLVVGIATWGTVYRSRRVTPRAAAWRHQRFLRTSVLTLNGVSYLMAILMSWFALRPLITRDQHLGSMTWLLLLAPLALVVLVLVIFARMGQGGSRLPAGDLQAAEVPVGDGTPDECWKWGQFYYNAADPALFVEKRAGLGWTLNFANKWSWVFLLAVLAGPPLLVLLFR